MAIHQSVIISGPYGVIGVEQLLGVSYFCVAFSRSTLELCPEDLAMKIVGYRLFVMLGCFGARSEVLALPK